MWRNLIRFSVIIIMKMLYKGAVVVRGIGGPRVRHFAVLEVLDPTGGISCKVHVTVTFQTADYSRPFALPVLLDTACSQRQICTSGLSRHRILDSAGWESNPWPAHESDTVANHAQRSYTFFTFCSTPKFFKNQLFSFPLFHFFVLYFYKFS